MGLTDYSEVYTPEYPQFVEIWKEHEKVHWHVDEAKMNVDVEQWKRGDISNEEKILIANILRLFTTSDMVVGQGYYERLIPHIKNNEARNMLGSFANRESVHQVGYALLSDTLGFGQDFYWEFRDYYEMSEKYEFMIEPSGDDPAEFAAYLAKQTLIEGVNLFASFAMLLNFDRLGKLPGMCDVVRWSSCDEMIHVKGNFTLFHQYVEENPSIVTDSFKKEIYDMARKLVELEDAFIDKCFEIGGVSNLTADEVKEYIRYVTDYRLNQIGFKANWGIETNPIPWIDYLMAKSFGNFFEREIVEYSKSGMSGSFDTAYPAGKN